MNKSFWGRFKPTERPVIYVLAGIMLLTALLPTLNEYLNYESYQLSDNTSDLLIESSPHYMQFMEVNQENGDLEYNLGYEPGKNVETDNLNSKFAAKFHANPKDGIQIIDSVNKTAITVKPKFPLGSPQQEDGRVVYPLRKFDGAKVITLGALGYKEDIVLDEFVDSKLDFEYELDIPDGVEARLEHDGSLSFYGVQQELLGEVATDNEDDAKLLENARKNGEKSLLLFRSPVPYIAEKNKDVSDAKVEYSLDGNILTVSAWDLDQAQYPISIDPSIYVETARKLMRGNNESNIDFDIDNELIKKGFTTGARFDSWNDTMDLNDGRWNGGTAVAGGFIYAVGGEKVDQATSTYSTAGADTFVVPAGVTEITVKVWGAGGGGGGGGTSGGGGAGGGGGFAQATLSVTPSESLNVIVGGGGGAGDFSTGGAGSSSGDGGGGGGHSEINRSGTNLVIAGGGGGGGGGDNSSSTPGGGGGAGGGDTADDGSNSSSASGGGGGDQSAGGAGGDDNENDGNDGGSETGGTGADGGTNDSCTDGTKANGGSSGGAAGGTGDECNAGFAGGGGGGSGQYGGGGGGSSIASNAGGGGGGGGSSYVTGTATTETTGSGTVPGNDSDTARSGAGDGGDGGASSGSGSAGDDGIVVITYSSGGGSGPRSDVYWAQLSTSNNSIESPNPGDGVCTDWCTDSAYDLPDERAGFSLVAYNGFLYVIGGVDDSGTRQSTVYISKLGVNGEPSLWHPTDDDQDNWDYWYSSSNSLTNATSYGSAAAYNNRLYFAGGQTNADDDGVDEVYMADFDPTGDIEAWTTTGITALPSDRHMHSMHVYNDYMYIVGGNSNDTLQSSVHFTKIDDDGTLNVWTATESFTTARSTWGGHYSVVWGGYIYLGGGCTAVNGSGYCTTIADDVQLASINADGSLDIWNTITSLSNQRIGYGFLAWDNGVYRIGGCDAQDSGTGECTSLINDEDYGVINSDGDASTVSISEADGNGDCTGATPFNCDLPPAGDDAGEAGHMLSSVAIINGFLYVVGGCVDYNCDGSSPQPTNTTGNIAYVEINTDGTLGKPSSCIDSYYGSWCVDSTNRVNGTTGTASGGTAVFGGRMYVIGGLTGSGNHGLMFSNTVEEDGSLSGAWDEQDLGDVGLTSDISYTYTYARANPNEASTYPGNLYIFGGCGSTSQAGCTSSPYETEVYKCNIQTDGLLEEDNADDCTTSGQLQIDSDPDTGGSQGLGIHSGTVYANYIYLVGGYSQTEIDKDTVMYAQFDDNNDVVAVSGSEWIESPNTMSIGRRRGFSFGYNGYIYAVGGFEDSGGTIIDDIEFAKVDVSDGSIGEFTTSIVTINQRWGLQMAVSNSYAYVIGGCDSGDSPNSCSSFEPSVQTFQLYNNNSGSMDSYGAGANLFSTDRYGGSSAIIDGYLYVAGGCTSTGSDCTDATNSVQYAQIDEEGDLGSWSATTANLPADRTWGQLEAAGGTLYYIGGQDDTATNEQSTVYYGTPSSGNVSTWSTASNGLPAARTQFSAAVWNDRIYVTGGLDSSATESNTVYISPQQSSGGDISSSWTTETTNVFEVARSGMTTVAYGNNLYIIGGHDGSDYLSDSQFTQINTDGSIDAWTYTTNLPNAIRQGDGFAANGYIYVIGGRSSDTECTSNTFITPISANTTIATGNNPTGVGEWYETNENYTGDRYGNAVSYYEGKTYVMGGACPYTAPPSVTSVTTTTFNSDTTSHDVDMPATVDSGDLLITLFTNDGNDTVTTPSGWTQLATDNRGTAVRASVYGRDADGTEDGSTVDFVTSGSEEATAHVYRIAASEWFGTLSTGAEATANDPGGATSTPNPPSLNPTNWGEENSLWLAYTGASGYPSVTSYPSGYSNGQHNDTGSNNSSSSVSSAERQELTADEDPPAFTMPQSENAVEVTVGIRPPATVITLTGSDRVAQSAVLSQPQVAKYSRMIDTDTDVFPTKFLLNGIDNSVGARWQISYRSSTDANSEWGQETDFGDVTLGTVNDYTPLDDVGSDTEFARFFYFSITIDSSVAYGYPEDVNRGPTINDLTLFFTADPSKRLRHGKSFTGGEKQPLDTPPPP